MNRYVSETGTTNVNKDFVEAIAVDLVNRNMIFNKATAKGVELILLLILKKTID